jgi:prepilin-type N-terminal cleavage/methylation domain-containing protein
VSSKAGFSLTELAVVLAIVMVVTGVSLPSISRTVDNAKLTSAAQQLASFYQTGRIQATQDNNYYVLPIANNIQGSGICLDLDGDGACSATEPQAQMPARVRLSNNGVPVLPAAATLGFTAGLTTTENSGNYGQQGTLEPGLAWNALGLPCSRSSSTSPCSAGLAWIQCLQLRRAGGEVLYAAVTVSPTGNVHIWHYSAGSWF